MAPTGSPSWVTDLIDGDRFLGGSSTPAAVAGYPNITVPAGDVFGLPVGVSFFAARGRSRCCYGLPMPLNRLPWHASTTAIPQDRCRLMWLVLFFLWQIFKKTLSSMSPRTLSIPIFPMFGLVNAVVT